MSKFYSYVAKKGDSILERGYENGQPFMNIIKYEPYLFVRDDSLKNPEYKTIHGEPVKRIDFDSMSKARSYAYNQKNAGRKVYGLTDFEFLYIYENYPKNFKFDYSLLNVVNIDIETGMTKYSLHKKVLIRKRL